MLAYRTAILLLISYFYGHSTPEQHGKNKIRPDMLSMSYVSTCGLFYDGLRGKVCERPRYLPAPCHILHVKHSRPFLYLVHIEFKQRWQRLMVILVISGDPGQFGTCVFFFDFTYKTSNSLDSDVLISVF